MLTWNLDGAVQCRVVDVGMRALLHHRLRDDARALGVDSDVLQLGDAQFEQQLGHLRVRLAQSRQHVRDGDAATLAGAISYRQLEQVNKQTCVF